MLAPLQFSPGGSGTAAVLLLILFAVVAYGGYVLLRRSGGDGDADEDVEELKQRVEELEAEPEEDR